VDPDRACQHEVFDVAAVVTRLADTGLFQFGMRVHCVECGEPFVFPDSIQAGIDLQGVARSLDCRELRVAVRAESQAAQEAL
jgi:hypothetical protein